MEAPTHNQEMTRLIADLSQAHHYQRQQLADSFEENIILFSPELEVQLINAQTLSIIPRFTHAEPIFDHLTLYTQKRHKVSFDLKQWLKGCLQQPNEKTFQQVLWLNPQTVDPEQPSPSGYRPVQLRVYPILNTQQQIESLLVYLRDLSLEIEAEAQLRMMEASYAGQFVTNAQGQITRPNYAFCAYTGLKPDELKHLTYLDWLKQQVALRVPFGQVMESLLNEGSWSGEVEINASSDAKFHAVLNLSMLTDENRNVEHFIGVLQDITDIQEARSHIERLAYFDKVTGLANRTLLTNQIEGLLQKEPAKQSYSALILLDLDDFNILNDTLGHAIGDQLLILVSQKLTRLTHSNDLIARLDGDEFGVLLKEISDNPQIAYEQALSLAYSLQDTLDDRYTIQNRSLHSSTSVGLYLFPQSDTPIQSDQVIAHANLAMHEAKNLGGNQVFVFEDKLCEAAKQRLEMLQALNHSELDEEFQLYFQAQVDSQGRTIAAETLLRWFHPTLGYVPPAEFIPVAEEGRQIIKIGLWVLHKAFLQAKAWNEQGHAIRVSINISPIQFHEPSFAELVIGLVKFTQVKPETITLELTEGVLIQNSHLALQKIQHLVSLGFHISIDDFGTGYSSLSYLQKLPLHELKIDQSFIRHAHQNPEDMAIVESILKLAHTKHLKVVAEGVETEEQAHFLWQHADTLLIQGYAYSRPAPACEFETTFMQNRSR